MTETQLDDIFGNIYDIYMMYDPALVDLLPTQSEEWRGKEPEFLEFITNKYLLEQPVAFSTPSAPYGNYGDQSLTFALLRSGSGSLQTPSTMLRTVSGRRYNVVQHSRRSSNISDKQFDDIFDNIYDIYMMHEPNKVFLLPMLFRGWRGREHEFLEFIQSRDWSKQVVRIAKPGSARRTP